MQRRMPHQNSLTLKINVGVSFIFCILLLILIPIGFVGVLFFVGVSLRIVFILQSVSCQRCEFEARYFRISETERETEWKKKQPAAAAAERKSERQREWEKARGKKRTNKRANESVYIYIHFVSCHGMECVVSCAHTFRCSSFISFELYTQQCAMSTA